MGCECDGGSLPTRLVSRAPHCSRRSRDSPTGCHEERLDDLDRRVSRIEGVLMLRADQDLSASAGEPG